MQITMKPERRTLPSGGGDGLAPDLTRSISVHVLGDHLEPVVDILLQPVQRDPARRVGRSLRGRLLMQRAEELHEDLRCVDARDRYLIGRLTLNPARDRPGVLKQV